MSEEQLELPLDHKPSLNHLAKKMANEDVESGACSNWDAAYESAWNYLEEHGVQHNGHYRYYSHCR